MRTHVIVWMGVALLLVSCGSGGSGAPTTPIATVNFSAVAAESGYIVDGTTLVSGGLMAAGDFMTDVDLRGFYRFSTAALPAGAVVVGATLRTGLNGVIGDPFAQFGHLVVDHIDMVAGLNLADFNSAPLTAVIGVLATNDTVEAKSMNVTAAVQADRAAARTTSDFRMYFVGSPDGLGDHDFITLTNTGTPGVVGVEPQLTIEYTVP